VLFDTRYFWTLFTERNQSVLRRLRKIFEASKKPMVSPITVYEIHKLSLEKEGNTVAELRTATIKKEFTVADLSSEIAEEGARIGHRLRVPMADALIMATAKELGVACVTDDPHFTEVKKVWV